MEREPDRDRVDRLVLDELRVDGDECDRLEERECERDSEPEPLPDLRAGLPGGTAAVRSGQVGDAHTIRVTSP